MTTLSVDHVVRAFGGVRAVDDVSFQAAAGSIHAIIGPNGAGKTTLFNLISGVLPPTTGAVRLDEVTLHDKPSHQIAELGVIRTFQHPRVFTGWTVRDNVMLGAHLEVRAGFLSTIFAVGRQRHLKALAEERADTALGEVGLGDAADLVAGHLTTGQERLMDMARALAARPRVLLLDEPAAGLTPIETRQLAQRLKDLKGPNRVIVVIEHDMSLVFDVADSVMVMNQGRLIASGPPAQVAQEAAVREAYLGSEALEHAGG